MVTPFFTCLSLFPTPLVFDVLQEFAVPGGLEVSGVAPEHPEFTQPFLGVGALNIRQG
jgi:hypothetical protein